MKRVSMIMVGIMMMVGMAASAHALKLQYSNNGTTWYTVLDNSPNDHDGRVGNIYFSTSTLSGFSNVQIIGTTELHGNGGGLFTDSIEMTGSARTLYIKFSDYPFYVPLPINPNSGRATSGLTLQRGNATVDLATYYGPALFSTEHALSNLHLDSPDFISADASIIGITSPFALTEVLTIHHNGSTTSQVTASLEITNTVPEPGTLVLLGAGFFGLAIFSKRRRG